MASASNINNFNNNYENVRMVFDNCSQKSFIKSDLCERLRLKKVRTELLTMKTFGNTEEKIERLEVVNIKIASLCGKY